MVAFYATLTAVGVWLFLTHDDVEPLDPDVVRRANAICARAQAVLAARPALDESHTFEQRADRVDTITVVFEDVTARLRTLSDAGEHAGYDEWMADWEEYVSVGPKYAAAIRTGDPDVYEPAGDEGDRPMTEVNRFARRNGMEDCVF